MTRAGLIAFLAAIALPLLVTSGPDGVALRVTQAAAEPASAEQQAFDSAKELGTVDAWNAFLKNYPTGFNADLAKAYIKKLTVSDGAPTIASQTAVAGSTNPAEELPCKDVPKLVSENSNQAAQIIFVNVSGETRAIQWIGFNGEPKQFANLDPGHSVTIDTQLTHAWIAADAAGNCSQVFRPGPGATLARLERNGAMAPRPSDREVTRDRADAPAKKVYRETTASKKKKSNQEDDHGPTPLQTCRDIGQVYSNGVCVKPKSATPKANAANNCKELGMAYKNGQCVASKKSEQQQLKKQKKIGCPKGTYLNPLGKCQPNETGA